MNAVSFQVVSFLFRVTQTFQYIKGTVIRDYGLDERKKDKEIMRVNGFLQVLFSHWKYSTGAYHTMRYFIQHDVLLTLIAISASRPSGLEEGCAIVGLIMC